MPTAPQRCRTHLKRRGIQDRIARRRIERNDRFGRHRWVVERPHAWLAAFDLESRYGEIDIPIFMKGGWFDAFAAGTLRNRGVGNELLRSS